MLNAKEKGKLQDSPNEDQYAKALDKLLNTGSSSQRNNIEPNEIPDTVSSYPKSARGSHSRKRFFPHRRLSIGRKATLLGSWILSVTVAIILSVELVSFPSQYFWVPSYIASLAIGILIAIRIYRYAFNSSNIKNVWTARILMSLGLVSIGFLLIFLNLSAIFSSFSFYPETAAQISASNLMFNFVVGIDILLAPILLAFLAGESYLLYRLRHHYSVSQW